MVNTDNMKKVLVLAPHTDDGELGCGGTVARLLQEGKEVFYVAFSSCEDSIPKVFHKDSLKEEVKKATSVLGIDSGHLILKDYKVRRFPEKRQEILEELILLRDEIDPDVVFLPSWHALHQDHKTISEEGLRAFKRCSCFGYDLPWDLVTFNSIAFVRLDAVHIEKKVRSLQCYKTQLGRSYINPECLRGLARTRGTQIGQDYAEAFEVMRLIV